jgi:hypothetical protein
MSGVYYFFVGLVVLNEGREGEKYTASAFEGDILGMKGYPEHANKTVLGIRGYLYSNGMSWLILLASRFFCPFAVVFVPPKLHMESLSSVFHSLSPS